jgi:pimeloyl-ACP methyl ester carboxylesterase
VQFAALLRERYPSARRVEVFANHDGKKALRQILRLLDANGDGILTATEKEQARIIIYGHSWGGAQAVTLARQLGRQGIRVLLTVICRAASVRPNHLSDQNFDHDYYFQLPLQGAGCPIKWTTSYFTSWTVPSFPAFEPNLTNCGYCQLFRHYAALRNMPRECAVTRVRGELRVQDAA